MKRSKLLYLIFTNPEIKGGKRVRKNFVTTRQDIEERRKKLFEKDL